MDELHLPVILSGRDSALVDKLPDPAAVAVRRPTERVAFLDISKGIGILLVVVGHCLAGLHDAGLVRESSLAWLGFYIIYCFHMPLFFFLSGLLVEARVSSRHSHFLESTVTRIAYPYFLWGSIQTVVLILATGVINHPHSPLLGHSLIQQIWVPTAQFWFLYVLFFMHSIALITLRQGGRLLFVAVLAFLYTACIGWSGVDKFVVAHVSGTNILFYAFGVCLGGPMLAWRSPIKGAWQTGAIGGVLLVACAWSGFRSHANFYSYVTLPAACAGVIAVIVLSRDTHLSQNRWLSYLGRLSMAIYVTHVLFIAGARIVLVKLIHVDNVGLILPVIFLAGVAGPLGVVWVARRLRLQGALGLG